MQTTASQPVQTAEPAAVPAAVTSPQAAAPTAAPGQTLTADPATGAVADSAPAGSPQSAAELLTQPQPAVPADLLQQVQDFMHIGGPVVWVLTAMSVLAVAIVLLKLWQFVRLRPESTHDVERALELWKCHEHTAALKVLDTRRPVSLLVATAIRGSLDPISRPQLLKDELQRIASRELESLRALLRPLELIAGLAPLLGLLGTVLGMITAFQQMQTAGSQVDPSVLSGGIWEALLTTAVGLVVAIPVLAAHSWLERKAERVAARMNDAVTRVFTLHNGSPAIASVATGVSCAA